MNNFPQSRCQSDSPWALTAIASATEFGAE
jgi:hypothetical protein